LSNSGAIVLQKVEFDQTTIVSLSDLVHSVVNREKWWFVRIPECYGCYSGVMEMQLT